MSASLTEQLRKVATALRKRAALQTSPKVVGNPVASRATGDIGSMGEGAIDTALRNKPAMSFNPQALGTKGIGPTKPSTGAGPIGPGNS